MSFRIRYQPLCNVNIWHGYYLHPDNLAGNALSTSEQNNASADTDELSNYNILKDLTVTQDPANRQLMSGHKIVFRSTPTGLTLWLQVRQNGPTDFAPFIPFSEPLHLSFYLQIRKPAFLNFTDIPLERLGDRVYYFSNRANNSSAGTHYLNAAGVYASNSDRVDIRPRFYSLDVSTLALTEIRFVLSNILERKEIVFRDSSPLEECRLDWSGLPAGLYDFTAFDGGGAEIASLREQFYLDIGELPPACLAVIEIFHLPGVDLGQYSLLDITDNETLLEPDYTLWWQNRLTQWRYLFKKSQTVAPDPGGDVVFTDAEQTQLVTRDSQPLISGYRPIRFQQDIAGTEINEEILLPNPGVENLYHESGSFFSDVYLGNFDLSRV